MPTAAPKRTKRQWQSTFRASDQWQYIFFEYYDYKEFIYKPSDKYWGDDSYQVMLPEWRVLLDKHGTPYEKEKLHPSDQPERINNEFGIIALFKDGKGLGPVLTDSAHFLWERGSTGIATIKGDCLTVFSGSAAPSGKLYARAGTSFLDYVARFDADSYGYGFNIVSVQRFVEKNNGDSEQDVRAISKEEFRQESNCQTQE